MVSLAPSSFRFSNPQPLIVIVGPTASGKTELAISIAKEIKGEIICADSRTIYKGMAIGTAKPTAIEQSDIPHFGLDLSEPGERFTAANFQAYAVAKISEIRDRGHIPILVGGTGLYIDAVLFSYRFKDNYDVKKRNMLLKKTIQELQDHCISLGIELPINQLNQRHLINAIEQGGINNNKSLLPLAGAIILGISVEKQFLKKRVRQRADKMFELGVVKEATNLAEAYGWESEAMTANIYKLIKQLVDGKLTQAEVIEKFIYSDMHLAKRQMTWFKRNPYILWSDDPLVLKRKCISSLV